MLDRGQVLPHLIARIVDEQPDLVAMLDVEGRQATYRELQRTYRTWSDAYRRLGIEAGDTVVTMLPNSFVAYEAWLGAAWLGAIEVPCNNGYLGDMLRHVLNDSLARVLVVSSRFVERVAGIAADLTHLETVVVPDVDDVAHGDADRKRKRETRACALRNAVRPFIKFDGNDAAGQSAFDRAGDTGLAGQPEIQRSECIGAQPGPKQQRRDVGHRR